MKDAIALVKKFINTHQAGANIEVNSSDLGYVEKVVDFTTGFEEKELETGTPVGIVGALPFRVVSETKAKIYQFSPANYTIAMGSSSSALETWTGTDEYDFYWTDVLADMQTLIVEKYGHGNLLRVVFDHKNIVSSGDVPVLKNSDGTLTFTVGLDYIVDYINGFAEFVSRDSHSAWQASTRYFLGDLVTSSVSGVVFECTTAGTSGAASPTWDTTIGNTTSDGTAVFTARVLFQDGDTVKAKYKAVPAAGTYLPLKPGALLAGQHVVTITSTDPDTGKSMIIHYPKAEIKPDGKLQMSGDNFWVQGVTISPVYDETAVGYELGYARIEH